MVRASRLRILAALRFFLLLVLSLASLVGGALLAYSLAGAERMAAALAGFVGYLLLFAGALAQLPVDWNAWLARSLEGFRSPAGRSPAVPGRAA